MQGARRAEIAIVIPSFADTGGINSVAEFVIRTIRRRDDLSFRVVSLATWWRDPVSTRLTDPATWIKGVTTRNGSAHGVPFIHVGATMAEFETQRLKPRKELAALLEGCDLIQVLAGTPAWILSVVGLGKPIIASIATTVELERRRPLAQARGLLGLWRKISTRQVVSLDKIALASADALLVMNPDMMRLGERLNAERGALVRYAPPGIDTDLFRPRADGQPASDYILTVGRLDDSRKNIGMLLEAFALVCERCPPSFKLVLAGAGAPTTDDWKRIDELKITDRVEFISKPSPETLSKLYRNAAAFALSSDEEGFGMVVVEAMSSGTPVVATRCGGPEAIVTDGLDGYLVDRGDVRAMADRLLAVVMDRDMAARIGQAARRTVENRYADDVAGDVFLDVYDHFLAKRA